MHRFLLLGMLCSLLAASACGGVEKLDSKTLTQAIESVGSVAAEGSLLAKSVEQGRTTSVFARVHAGELAAMAEQGRASLASARAPGLEEEAARALELSRTVAALLARLEDEPASRETAGLVRRQLREAARQAERLQERS
jgi:hypothetical protein